MNRLVLLVCLLTCDYCALSSRLFWCSGI